MVNVSDGKGNPEPNRLKLSAELLILQRLDTSTINSEVKFNCISGERINIYMHKEDIYICMYRMETLRILYY